MDNSNLYSGLHYPAEIISHAVWLYFRFSLSFRDVEELLASRGIIVSYETVRQWTLKFGQLYANALRRKQPKRGDKWHLDEVVLTIKGKHHYLWRAVDQDGHTPDILMQNRRNRHAVSVCSPPPIPCATRPGPGRVSGCLAARPQPARGRCRDAHCPSAHRRVAMPERSALPPSITNSR